jgi:exodeoxyribonuclease VII small subunit
LTDNPTPSTTSKPDEALARLSYEQARDELVVAVQRLEAGGLSLEESLVLWERGESLAQHCQDKLDGVRNRLDAAVAARDRGEDRRPPQDED